MRSRLTSHIKFRRRQKSTVKIVILTILIVICILPPLSRLISQFILLEGVSDVAQSIINLLMFIVTAFMAWVTYKTFLTMKEARVAEVKPILLLDLDSPDISEGGTESTSERFFSTEIVLRNYSRSPAIDIRIRLSIPRDVDNFIAFDGTISPILYPSLQGNNFEVKHKVEIPIWRYEVEEYKKDFLELEVLYEDMERNLYRIRSFFGIVKFGNKYFLRRSFEELYITNFKSRSYFEDLGTWTSEDKEELVFCRKNFLMNIEK
jgi:hypothetical protein